MRSLSSSLSYPDHCLHVFRCQNKRLLHVKVFFSYHTSQWAKLPKKQSVGVYFLTT